MKAAPGTPLYNTLRRGHAITAQPRLWAEWNYNRFVETVVTNHPLEEDEGYDVELFPIESIAEAIRPTRGIVKGKVGQAKVSREYTGHPNSPRYYVIGDEDKYRYWCSPYPAGVQTAANMPLANNGVTTASPRVQYQREIMSNKIVIGFETSWAKPDNYELFVKYNETGAWTSIGSNFPIDSGTGQVTLYHNGTSWGTPVVRTGGEAIWGIQLRVYSMDTPGAYLNLIEISARLEKNLSRYVMRVSDQFTMSNLSFITPLGTCSANTGTITLFNDLVDDLDPDQGLLFNNDNSNSPYHRLIDENVRLTMGYMIDCSDFGGAVEEYVQAFNMWTTLWNNQLSGEVEVSVQDSSKFLQMEHPRPTMHERVSIGGIIWRILDSLGFSNYQVQGRDDDPNTIVPVFYTDGESNVWEEFQALAEGTQTAIFFDENDTLQVRTRRAAYNETKNDWTLRAEPSGADLPDIIEMSQTENFEANFIKVNYQTTQYTDWNNGMPKLEVVWQPEEALVLRASRLRRSLENGDAFIWLDKKEARVWPWSGIMNIEGEIIRYDGKQYVYYTNQGREARVINSTGELRRIRDATPENKKHMNHFTGALHVATRGMWNTESKPHRLEINGWNVNTIRMPGNKQGGQGLVHHKQDSYISIRTRGKTDNGAAYLVTRGQSSDGGYFYYGTELWFPKGNFAHDKAGIAFHINGVNGAGYYAEIQPSSYMNGTKRQARHEVVFYSMDGNGNTKKFGGQYISAKNGAAGSKSAKDNARENKANAVSKGYPYPIRFDTRYALDITLQNSGDDHIITIYVDGTALIKATVPSGGGWRQPWGGKFGAFVRGNSYACFEYIYAVGRDEGHHPDSVSFFDRVSGGYISDQWMREWSFRTRKDSKRPKKKSKKETEKYAALFMDEFGPIAHEVRQFEVNFEPSPVLHSKLYLSNDWSVVCPEYRSDSFGANFVLANTSRRNAIINGEDSLSFAGTGATVDQASVIYGRALVIKEAEIVKVKNEDSIRQRGRVETEITSKWIQTQQEAELLGRWIENHWSRGNDELQVTMFGNPLIQVGDVVRVDYPEKDYFESTHKYFVVGTSTDFEQGLQTVLTLRRCKI